MPAILRTVDRKPARSSEAAARHDHQISPAAAWPDDVLLFVQLDPIAQSREVREGMAPGVISRVATDVLKTSVQSLLASLRIPSSTVTRKLAAGDRLSSGESDRISRVILVHAHAADVFEDRELAAQWMQATHAELDGEAPIAMLDTQAGYDQVQRILHRIEFGVGV